MHNGIIENFAEIRQRLEVEGYVFTSDTDTEAIAHLIEFTLKRVPDLFEAVHLATAELVGAYAIAVLSEGNHDGGRIIAARHGAPLMLGIGKDGHYAASDASALLQVTRTMVYLEDGDIAEITRDGLRIANSAGLPVERPSHESSLSADAVELGQFQHFMQKEIFEQPTAISNTLEMLGGTGAAHGFSTNMFGAAAPEVLKDVGSVLILACGTSFHAGMVARYWIEQMAGVSLHGRDCERIPLSRLGATS